MKNERDLVCQFREAKIRKDETEEIAKKAKAEFDKIESELIEAMDASGIETTAKYEGVGYCRMMTPRLYASFLKENEDSVFKFLKVQKRDDLIKPTVHSASLSSFVGELVESGGKIPEFISFYMKKSIRLY